MIVLCVVSPAAAEARRFHAFVTCGSGPSHVCYEGDLVSAQFRDTKSSATRYHVCEWGPGGEFQGCADPVARNHKPSRVTVRWDGLGWYTMKWWVHGKRIKVWKWELRSEGV